MEPGYPNLIHSRKGEAGKQLLFGWIWLVAGAGWMDGKTRRQLGMGVVHPPPGQGEGKRNGTAKKWLVFNLALKCGAEKKLPVDIGSNSILDTLHRTLRGAPFGICNGCFLLPNVPQEWRPDMNHHFCISA